MENTPTPKNVMSPEELYDWTVNDTAELEAQKAEAEGAGDEERAQKIGGYIATNEKQLASLSKDIEGDEPEADITASVADVTSVETAKSAQEELEDRRYQLQQDAQAAADVYTKR
ncbi:hypothetical protein J6X13_03270 [Candidatus Saccharibacteria bacterium]|nr:hypothetical protein [Candidatus Saccharibacteria bacterium]